MPIKEFSEGMNLVFATANGTVKKTTLSAYANIRSNGLIALTIEEGDRLVAVRSSNGKQQIVLGTAHGKATRFSEEEVRATGRPSMGS